MKKFVCIALVALMFTACTKGTNERYLIIKFKFDPTQARLNSFGRDTTIPLGNAAQTPTFNSISADWIALSTDSNTKYNDSVGLVELYKGATHFTFNDSGIDYSKALVVKEGEAFLTLPLSAVKPGTYEFLRVSLAYQNFNVNFRLDTTINSFTDPVTGVNYPGAAFGGMFTGTLASFIGYNTYFDSLGYSINSHHVPLYKQFRPQGYWAFETIIGSGSHNYPAFTKTDVAPFGATTVVNPLYDKSPTPAGSSIVTGAFYTYQYDKAITDPTAAIKKSLVITGAETESILIECNLSINKSFEWREIGAANGVWEPFKGEPVIDMGIRSMKPFIIK